MQYAVAILALAGSLVSAVPAYAPAANSSVAYVTSTVYATTEITVLACATTVVSCPAESATETVVITSTISGIFEPSSSYTTICPATESPSVAPVPASTSAVVSVISSSAAAIPATSSAAAITPPAVSTTYTYAVYTTVPIGTGVSSVSALPATTVASTGFASGSGVGPTPTSSSAPIFTGAAMVNKVQGAFGAAGALVAAAAMLL
ncbi:hypothetical protein MMC25_008061 [Agyrium rufum]|nr:hypothetical protein [Agyrium rufum]